MEKEQQPPLNKRTFFTYILIALGFTWACWIPSLMLAQQNGYTLPTVSNMATEPPLSFANLQHVFTALLFSLAVYGPLLGGFIATYMAQGKQGGAQNLRNRMLRWRIPGKWYLTLFADAA